MSLILNTELVERKKRASVISDAIVYASVPCDVELGSPDYAWARMTYVDFGGGASVYSHAGSGLRLIRRRRHLSKDSRQRLGIAIHGAHAGGVTVSGEMRQLKNQELLLVDLTQPYEYFWAGAGRADCFQVDYELLGVRVDLVRAAAGRLRSSPLYDMVRTHIATLCAEADVLGTQAPAATAAIGTGTARLVAALLCTAVGEGPQRDTAMAETMKPRLLHWLNQHIEDPELDVDAVAAAHGLSSRQLRSAWARMDMAVPMEDWLVAQRSATAEENRPPLSP